MRPRGDQANEGVFNVVDQVGEDAGVAIASHPRWMPTSAAATAIAVLTITMRRDRGGYMRLRAGGKLI